MGTHPIFESDFDCLTEKMGIDGDIFQLCKDGNLMKIKQWLDNTENDLNQGDDHWFTPLHWAARAGHLAVVELLISRGARVSAKNRGDDTPLHNAAQCGHAEVTCCLVKSKSQINAQNEHGNAPLHYACFANYEEVARHLVRNGAYISLCNKYNQTPLDKARPKLRRELEKLAHDLDQDMEKIPYQEQLWPIGETKPNTMRLHDKHNELEMKALNIRGKIRTGPNFDLLKGKWKDTEVVVKLLTVPKHLLTERKTLSNRHIREFNDEYAKTRIFSHQNILPALGSVNRPETLAIVAQYMPLGSLYSVLHEGRGIPVVDNAAILNYGVDIARGMAFLHELPRHQAPRFNLNPRHIVIDEDQRARINLCDSSFSLLGNNKVYEPAWMAPELLAPPSENPKQQFGEVDRKKADMWSFAIVLWEMVTREVPFAEYSPMQQGLKIAMEHLRVLVPIGISPHMAKMISICMKDDPSKRPKFDQIVAIIERMANQ